VLADALGRRRTLLASLLLEAGTAALLAFLRAPLAIAAAVLVFGAAAAASRPPLRAVVADVVPEDRQARAFGWLYWADNAGVSVSMLAGGVLAAHGWAVPFLVDSATTLGFALVVLLRIPETRPSLPAQERPARGFSVVLQDRAMLALLGLFFVVQLVYAQSMVALPIDMARRGLPPTAFGATIAVSALLVVLLQPVAPRVLGGLSPPATLALGTSLIGLGMGGYALCGVLWQFVLSTAVWTLGEIAFFATAGAVVTALSPPQARGRYNGAYGLCRSAARIAAPVAGPALLEVSGPGTLWAGCLGLSAAAALGLVAWGRGREATPRARGLSPT
jgi:MFS family permease